MPVVTNAGTEVWQWFATTLAYELSSLTVHNFVWIKDSHERLCAQIALAQGKLESHWEGRLVVEITDPDFSGPRFGVPQVAQPQLIAEGWILDPDTTFWERSINWQADLKGCHNVANLVVNVFRDVLHLAVPPARIVLEWDNYDRGYGFPDRYDLD
ncbi:TY-Chap domain-containing protein [Nocardia heshunensis]